MNTTERRKERLDRGIKARAEGLYAISSWREIAYLLAPRAGLIIGLLLLPLVVPGLYWQRVFGLAAVYALLALSFDFLAQRVGLVCIGGAFMIGVGGYISGSLNYYLNWPPLLTILIGTFGGALLCTLLWLPLLASPRDLLCRRDLYVSLLDHEYYSRGWTLRQHGGIEPH